MEEVILSINMEALSANPRMLGIVRGVAAVLGLDERRLMRHAAWLAGVASCTASAVAAWIWPWRTRSRG